MTDFHDNDEALKSLLDEAACRRVISRYSVTIDWADKEGLASIFWPDAKLNFGESFFIGSPAGGVEFLMASVNGSICRTHTLGSLWLTVGQSEARGESPSVNIWISRNPDGTITQYLFTTRYLWELQKRQGEWRVSSLQALITTAQSWPYDLGAQPPGFQLIEGLGVDHSLFPGSHLG